MDLISNVPYRHYPGLAFETTSECCYQKRYLKDGQCRLLQRVFLLLLLLT